MKEPRIIVITGASRGLGRAAAQRLLREGHRVIATAREATALDDLRAQAPGEGTIECHVLDVTNDASVAAFAAWLKQRTHRVDALINNAGVSLGSYSASVLELSLDTLRATLETNLFGALRVTQALAPLLRASPAGRIVNLSSGLGQLADMGSGVPAYRISKTALNALTRILSVELGDSRIKVNSACPGWCRTDMGGSDAPRSAEEGIDTIVWLATLDDDGPTGGFFRDRKSIPW